MSDLLSVHEAATLLRCSPETIRRRLRAGTLRYTRTGPGGHYRIQRADLLQPVPEVRLTQAVIDSLPKGSG